MAVMVFAFWQEDTDKQFFRSPDFKKLKADLVLYGIKYRRDTRGKASQWVVDADTARFYEKKRQCEFERVKIVFLLQGRQPVKVNADNGRYDFAGGDLEVSGDVVVKGFRDYVLYSDQLLYDPVTMTIKAPDKAEMVGSAGNSLQGKSMVYYIRQNRLTLGSPVAVISGEESGL